MTAQPNQGSSSTGSRQPAAKYAKMLMANGNFFVRFLNMYFFVTASWEYYVWPNTRKFAMLPPQNEWSRIRDEYQITVQPLSESEMVAAEHISTILTKEPLYGLSEEEREIATKNGASRKRNFIPSVPAPNAMAVPQPQSRPTGAAAKAV